MERVGTPLNHPHYFAKAGCVSFAGLAQNHTLPAVTTMWETNMRKFFKEKPEMNAQQANRKDQLPFALLVLIVKEVRVVRVVWP